MKCSSNSCFRLCSKVQTNTGAILLKLLFEESWQADWNTSLDQEDRWRRSSLEFIWIKHLALQWRHFNGTIISHTIIHGALMFACETQKEHRPSEVRYSHSLYKTDVWSNIMSPCFWREILIFHHMILRSMCGLFSTDTDHCMYDFHNKHFSI